MNKKRYLGDLLFLSPSFSIEEKKKIFSLYSKSEELLNEWIAILEDELKKIVKEYIDYENNIQSILQEFVQSFDKIDEKNQDKYKKIQKILEENKLQEASEKNFQDLQISNIL